MISVFILILQAYLTHWATTQHVYHHPHFPPACMELYMHGHLPLHLYFSLFLSNTEPTTCTIIQTTTSVTTQTAIRFVFCHRGRRFSEALLPWQCVPVILGRSMQRGFPAPPPQQQQSRLEVASWFSPTPARSSPCIAPTRWTAAPVVGDGGNISWCRQR